LSKARLDTKKKMAISEMATVTKGRRRTCHCQVLLDSSASAGEVSSCVVT
jgi:hypothetical protein